jgi:hypothetical protein
MRGIARLVVPKVLVPMLVIATALLILAVLMDWAAERCEELEDSAGEPVCPSRERG